MKFQAAVLALVASVQAEAKPHSRVLNAENVVPGAAFQDIASLQEKDQKARARLQRRIAKTAVLKKPDSRRANDAEGYDEQQWEEDWNMQYEELWDNEMVVEEFGFDIDNYALKYTGCHVAKGYNENVAEDENFETVLGADTYVTFRLCPEDTCNANQDYLYGCSSNYGEYMVSLDEYVEALVAYKEEKKYTFCEYCETCAAMTGYTNWNNQMKSTMQGIAENFEQALENFKEQQQYEAEQNGQNGNGNQNGYWNGNGEWVEEEKSDEEWEIEYYKAIRNGNANGNNGYNGYQYGQNGDYSSQMSSNVNAVASQWWDYSSAAKQNNNNNGYNNALYMSFEKGDWYTMNANYPTFCHQPVEPGYFDDAGDWISQVGYWNKQLGVYVPFTEVEGDEEANAGVPWDEDCWGPIPFGWDNVAGQDPEEFVACNENYSGQCSNGYEDCMYMLHFDDLMQMEFGDDYAYTEDEAAGSKTSQMFASQITQETFTQYLTCQVVEYVPEQTEVEQTAYSNQDNYYELYQQKTNYMKALQQCEDQDCEDAIEAAMETDMNYQAWIIESAWELYEKYKAANQAYYVGAYCMEDGFNIGLKVFHDQLCLYPNDDVSPETVLEDTNLGDVHLDAVTGQCIPCRDQQYYMNMELEEGAQEENLQDEDSNGVLAYCSMLYQISAKCNINLTPNKIYNQEGYYVDGVYYAPEFAQMYLSEQQEDQEKKVCSMVESLNSGSYKEDGSIYLNNGLGWGSASASRFRNEISSATSAMSPFVKTLVFLLAIGAAAMGLWAMVLHGAIQRKMAPWQPKDPVDLARQESGIVMGRSRSGPATNPLI